MNLTIYLYNVQYQFQVEISDHLLQCGISNIEQFVFCGLFLESALSWLEGTNASETQEGWRVGERVSPGIKPAKGGLAGMEICSW